jgi:uncharacterized protein YbjT (DUF2867 family)
LVDARVRVRALVRTAESADAVRRAGGEPVRGDLAVPATLDAALAGVEKVLLICPMTPRIPDLEAGLVHRARGTIHHMVKLSALSAGTAYPTASGAWHGESEARIRAAGVPFTFVRSAPTMPAVLQLGVWNGTEVAASTAGGRAAVVDPEDVAAVLVRALLANDHVGATLDATGPAALTADEMAKTAARLAGRDVRFVEVGPAEYRARWERAGRPNPGPDQRLRFLDVVRHGGFAALPTVERVTGAAPASFEAWAKRQPDLLAVLTSNATHNS